MKQLRWKDFSLVSKIVIEVGMIAVLLFAMNMLFYVRINNSMQKMDNVYASNAELTELSQVFEKVQDNMYKYLKVKSSQTLLDYYQNEAKYRNELEKLNEDNINDPVKLLERNIRKMSETYLDCTAETVAAKRGRNVEQYKRKYDDATKLYRYIQSSIDELNNLMFQENSSTYAVLRAVMRYLEISNSVIMIIIVAGGMLLLIQATRNMFVPLSNMAETAQLVGQGNFHVKMHDTDAQDELGTVTRAFNTMVENLDLYMARTKASMEKEQQMMERDEDQLVVLVIQLHRAAGIHGAAAFVHLLHQHSDHGAWRILSTIWFTHRSLSCDIIFPVEFQRLPPVCGIGILHQELAEFLPERTLPGTQHHHQQQHNGNCDHDNQKIVDRISKSSCHMYSFLWEPVSADSRHKRL